MAENQTIVGRNDAVLPESETGKRLFTCDEVLSIVENDRKRVAAEVEKETLWNLYIPIQELPVDLNV